MLALLLVIAAICLIVLNPFQGAAVIGTVSVGVFGLVALIGLFAMKSATKKMNKEFDGFHDRHFR